MFVAHLVFQRVEREQQADSKRRTGTQTRPCREVCDVMDLDTIVDAQELQAAANRRMLNSCVVLNILDFRIRYAAPILEKRRQPTTADVATFVNRSCQYGTAMFAVPDWI